MPAPPHRYGRTRGGARPGAPASRPRPSARRFPRSTSASPLEEALLNRAWSQWVALGVDAVGERDEGVVDPEALIALTAELGDADARLRDVSTDWCVAFGRYVNGARLRGVVAELGTPPDAIGEYVATVASAGGPRWPLATRP